MEQEAALEKSRTPIAHPDREFTVETRSQWRLTLRRFFRHRLAVASLTVLTIMVIAFLSNGKWPWGGRWWQYSYEDIVTVPTTRPNGRVIDLPASDLAPSLQHPMGTDKIGHDVFAQVLRGGQKSVQVMLLVALISTTIGVVIGAVAGFFRGLVDTALMRLIDLLLTIPTLAVLAVLSRRLSNSGSWWIVGVLIAAFAWLSIARVIRAEVLSLREKEFVEAARAVGGSRPYIIRRHILPNVVGTMIVAATLAMALAILTETTLSYLGLGIRAPDTSLGTLVSEAQAAASSTWWQFYFPGLVIVVIVLCINFIGDGLRDAFDPRQQRVRA